MFHVWAQLILTTALTYSYYPHFTKKQAGEIKQSVQGHYPLCSCLTLSRVWEEEVTNRKQSSKKEHLCKMLALWGSITQSYNKFIYSTNIYWTLTIYTPGNVLVWNRIKITIHRHERLDLEGRKKKLKEKDVDRHRTSCPSDPHHLRSGKGQRGVLLTQMLSSLGAPK